MIRLGRSARVGDAEEIVAAVEWARCVAAARGAEVVTDTDALAGLLVTSARTRQFLADAGVDPARLEKQLSADDVGARQEATAASKVYVPPHSQYLLAALEGARRRAARRGSSLATATDLLEALAGLSGCRACEVLVSAGADPARLSRIGSRSRSISTVPPHAYEHAGNDGDGGPRDVAGVVAAPERRTRTRAILSLARMAWDVARPLGKVPFGLVRGWLGFASDRIATLVFLPGVLALIGLRAVIGRLHGIPVAHGNLLTAFRGEMEIAGDRRMHWQRASIRLLPHLLLVAIGAVLLTTYMVQLVALGVSPLPAVTASPEVLVSKDLGWPVAQSALATYGPLDLLRLWTGLACWFCAAPGYANIKAGRQELAQAVAKHQRAAGLARAVGWATAPLQWVSRVLGVLDEAVNWLGANVLIASGGITLLILLIIERRIIAFLLS
jgi:hypothetical protein